MARNESPDLNQLDTQISVLHQQLNQLYRQRLTALRTQKPALNTIAAQFQNVAQSDTEAVYRRLAKAWQQYGLQVPAFSTFKTRLKRAEAINQKLGEEYEGLAGEMQIVLVPPTTALNKILQVDEEGQKQLLIDADVTRKKSTKWQVVTVYAGSEGIPLESDIFQNRQNLCALGVNEYLSLVIQEQLLIDEANWTVLLRNSDGTTAPCVAFANGSYRFMNDEIDSIFGDNIFRPAVEIKSWETPP